MNFFQNKTKITILFYTKKYKKTGEMKASISCPSTVLTLSKYVVCFLTAIIITIMCNSLEMN
jgi:hypothetical protein